MEDLEGFWRSIWDYDGIISPTPFTAALGEDAMPGARWFEGAQVNYARHLFRHVAAAEAAGQPAIIAMDERGDTTTLGWAELRRQSASLALELRARGIGQGDRVAAYLPNIPAAVVGLLACASLGAIWTLCSPEMGINAVLDRWRQTAPKALIAVDSLYYAGKAMDRSAAIAEICRQLPSIESVFLVAGGCGGKTCPAPSTSLWPSGAMTQRSRRSSLNGCPSITRCGSFIPAAPPACPRRSCTAMAASSWRPPPGGSISIWGQATPRTIWATVSIGTAPAAG